MTKARFYEIKTEIMGLGLEMDDFYETASNEKLAVDFVMNNIQNFEGNISLFVDSFTANFRAKNMFSFQINEVKEIVREIIVSKMY